MRRVKRQGGRRLENSKRGVHISQPMSNTLLAYAKVNKKNSGSDQIEFPARSKSFRPTVSLFRVTLFFYSPVNQRQHQPATTTTTATIVSLFFSSQFFPRIAPTWDNLFIERDNASVDTHRSIHVYRRSVKQRFRSKIRSEIFFDSYMQARIHVEDFSFPSWTSHTAWSTSGVEEKETLYYKLVREIPRAWRIRVVCACAYGVERM